MKLFVIFFALYNIQSAHQIDYSKAGPYDLKIHHVTECPDIGKGLFRLNFRIKKLNRTAMAVDCNATALASLDDSYSVITKVAQFTNGGWKENFFVKEFKKMCTTASLMFPSAVKEVVKAAVGREGIPACPTSPGNWTIRNYLLNINLEGIPVFFYNKYRSDISVTRFGTTYGCMRIVADVTPKKKTKSRG